jgi:hypothetical protein
MCGIRIRENTIKSANLISVLRFIFNIPFLVLFNILKKLSDLRCIDDNVDQTIINRGIHNKTSCNYYLIDDVPHFVN